MKMVKVELELPKESHELAQMLAGMAKAILDAGKDGFQVEDAVPIVTKMFSELSGEGLKDLKLVPGEIKKDPVKFALALAMALDKVL